MRKILFQWAGVGILSLGGWGVGLMPNITNWIPSITIWSIAFVWLIITIVYWLKHKRPREDKSFSQIYDLEMGKHTNRIVELLNIFKKQLLIEVAKVGHINIQVAVEKQRGFYQVWEHCPSVNKAGFDLRLSRILYEAKLKSNSVVDEDDSHIKEKMKVLADTIDNCLSDAEYLNHSCSNCIGKRNQLSDISKNPKPAIGGLIGHSAGGKVRGSHFKGKIIIKGKPEEVDAGGLIGQAENTEVEDSSAEAEIEYKQD